MCGWDILKNQITAKKIRCEIESYVNPVKMCVFMWERGWRWRRLHEWVIIVLLPKLWWHRPPVRPASQWFTHFRLRAPANPVLGRSGLMVPVDDRVSPLLWRNVTIRIWTWTDDDDDDDDHWTTELDWPVIRLIHNNSNIITITHYKYISLVRSVVTTLLLFQLHRCVSGYWRRLEGVRTSECRHS